MWKFDRHGDDDVIKSDMVDVQPERYIAHVSLDIDTFKMKLKFTFKWYIATVVVYNYTIIFS